MTIVFGKVSCDIDRVEQAEIRALFYEKAIIGIPLKLPEDTMVFKNFPNGSSY